MRKIAIIFFSLFGSFPLLAQVSVVGKIIDAKDGSPIQGATIMVAGEKTVTTSSPEGTFELKLKPGDSLEISHVGHTSQIVNYSAGDMLEVKMIQDTKGLTEVVVTALGIKKEKKALGYTVSTVGKKDLELRPESDIARVLNGKVPGLTVINTSGLSGSGTNIIVRAVGTITGNSQPLFVVDGVPFNGATNNNSAFIYGNQNSSRFLDLDPNNIENISVLKGLSATTIYGEFGRNGVILITTKNGSVNKSAKKTEMTLSQSFFVNEVSNLPEYNTKYGGGFDLSNGVTFYSNWGGPFSNPPIIVKHPYDRVSLNGAFPEFIGAPYEYKQYKNNVKNFFRKGIIANTSFNINGGNGTNGFNANFSYLKDNGFTIGNEMEKKTFGFGGSSKLSNNFTINGSFNYVETKVSSPPTSTSFGSGGTNVSVFGDVMYTPASVDLMGLPYQNPLDNSQVYYRSSNDLQNPRWTLYNSFTENNVTRAFGNLNLCYNFNKQLNLTYRIGFDNYTESQLYAQNKGGYKMPDGIMRSSIGKNSIWDQNLILNYNSHINDNWNLGIDAGLNIRNDIYAQTGILSTRQLVYGLMNHTNFIDHSANSEDGTALDRQSELETIGAYIQGQLGFKNYLYLNLGGRNGWTSALEKNNRSVFYPSASISFIASEGIEALKEIKQINYLKVRAGMASSAEFPDVYSTRSVLGISTRVFVDGTGNSINVNSIGDRLPNKALKSSLVNEFETGIEGRFFNSRITFDFTYYHRESKDQILDRDLDPSTGYSVQAINAGKVSNKGIELALGCTVIKSKKVRWQLDGLLSRNRSMVSDIPDDLAEIRTAGFTTLGNFAINGQPLGVIKGTGFLRADNGKILVGTNGIYLTDPNPRILGDPNPDYKLTGISSLTYKDFNLRLQVDYTQGGDMYSATSSVLLGRGVTRDTEFDRYLPIILPGVIDQAGNIANDRQISSTAAYFNNSVAGAAASESGMYDATVVRLREIAIVYNMPTNMLKNLPFGSVSLSISATNLWYYAPNFPKYIHFDPESTGFGVGNGRGLEFFSGPSSRRIGASLKITF